MRKSRIKRKLASGDAVLVPQLHLTDASVFELTSLLGFDGIWMDLEHHAYTMETAGQLMRAARLGSADIILRIARGEHMRMGRALEAGAQGIMYPRCDSADEAREVVRWAKFAPLGQRGFDGGNPDMPYCTMPIADYIRRANEETLIVVQIEDPVALDHVDEIAAVEGVDVLFFGPGDFSVLAGVPGQFDHPLIEDAIGRVAAAAGKAGIHWGTPSFSVEHARSLLGRGARFLTHGADIVWIRDALESIQERFGGLGFDFDRRLES